MAIVKSEFALALNQVASERGISADEVIESIEAAVTAAYKKEYPDQLEEEIEVKISKDNGETKILKAGADITPPGFGRIAAQTARQVILQKIREAEKKTVISHYKEQVGGLVKGRIIRYDGYNAYVDIGKTEAILPKEEQIRSEQYNVNDSLLFYLKEIGEDKAGHSRILLSRSAPELIAELFKREVPEIASGTVEIKKIVREPGDRAKIAVYSNQGGVDPVGACVGQKGVRVQTVTDELGGNEKIDIIQWNRDLKIFLVSSLSPAKIQSVEIDEAAKKAAVHVDESQAPLAIGRNGINVNLASRLTELEIDIVQIKSAAPTEVPTEVEAKEAATPAESQDATAAQEPNPEDVKTEAIQTPAEEVRTEPKTITSEQTTPSDATPTETKPASESSETADSNTTEAPKEDSK